MADNQPAPAATDPPPTDWSKIEGTGQQTATTTQQPGEPPPTDWSKIEGGSGGQAPPKPGIQNLLPSLNAGIAELAGAPVDFASWLIRQTPGLTPEWQKALTDAPGGSESIKRGMREIGVDTDYDPNSYWSVAGHTVPAMLGWEAGLRGLATDAAEAIPYVGRVVSKVPKMITEALGPASARSSASAATAGVAGAEGQQAVHENLPADTSPYVRVPLETGANVAGAFSTAGAEALLGKGLGWVGEKIGSYFPELGKAGQERLAGEKLYGSATDPAAARTALGAPENVPGSELTTFQKSGDPGLGQAERAVVTQDPATFKERLAEQNTARRRFIEDQVTRGDPNAVGQYFTSQLAALDTANAASENAARADVATRAGQVGGTRPPSETNPELRAGLQDVADANRQQTTQLWLSIDPTGRMTVGSGPLRQLEQDIQAGIRPTQRPPAGEEAAIYDVIRNLPENAPFLGFKDIRSRISAEIRRQVAINGTESAEVARLMKLRDGFDDAVHQAVTQQVAEQQAAVRAGTMAPDDTIISRITAQPGGPSSPLPPPEGEPMTPDALERYEQARLGTAQRKATYAQGPVGQVLAPGRAPYKMGNAGVLRTFIANDDAAPDNVQKLVAGFGGDRAQAVDALREPLAYEMRDAAYNERTGEFDPVRYQRWMDTHRQLFAAMPELGSQFGNLNTAIDTLATTTARNAANRASIADSAAQHFLGGVDPRIAVENAFRRGADFSQLMAQAATDTTGAATEGLQRAVIDHVLKIASGTAEAGTTGERQLVYNQLDRFLSNPRNEQALRAVLGDDRFNALRVVANDMQQANRSTTATKLPGGSNTAQDLAAQKKFGYMRNLVSGLGDFMRDVGWLAYLGEKVGGLKGAAVGFLARTGVQTYQQRVEAGRQAVDAIFADAIMNPERAEQLLTQEMQRRGALPRTPVQTVGPQPMATTDWRRLLLQIAGSPVVNPPQQARGGRTPPPRFRFQEGGEVEEEVPPEEGLGAGVDLSGLGAAAAHLAGEKAARNANAQRLGLPQEDDLRERVTRAKAATEDRQTGLFNLGFKSLARIPKNVAQMPLERYQARKYPEVWDEVLQRPDVREQMLQGLGTPDARKVGDAWYGAQPLRQAFIRELGRKEGQARFERFLDYVGATSAQSNVEDNLRNATFQHFLEAQGVQPNDVNPFPYPYGHMAQKSHRMTSQLLRDTGGFDIFEHPKRYTFGQNLRGNYYPVTVDTHGLRAISMLSQDPRLLAKQIRQVAKDPSTGKVMKHPQTGKDVWENVYPQQMYQSGQIDMPTALSRPKYWTAAVGKNVYPTVERYMLDLAQQAGLPGAHAQAGFWLGHGQLTGLGSVPEPWMHTFDRVLHRTAHARGEDPQETLRRFIRGEAPLYHEGGEVEGGLGYAEGGAADDDDDGLGAAAPPPFSGADEPSGLIAWHGSPYQFEQFSRSKIGTGQGAASYGRGTAYVAEARPVAEGYRRELSYRDPQYIETHEGRVHPNDIIEDMTPHQLATFMAASFSGDAAAALQSAESHAMTHPRFAAYPNAPNPWEPAAALLRQNPHAYEGLKWRDPGHLYRLQINARPEHFLHWDKQLNQQSPHVRAAIEKIAPKPSADEVAQAQQAEIAAQNRYQNLYESLKPQGQMTHPDFWPGRTQLRVAEQEAMLATTHRQNLENLARGEMTGEDFYEHLVKQATPKGPPSWDPTHGTGAQQAASDQLEQAGIPGIRYLDQKSRDAKPRDEIETDLADWQDELDSLRSADPRNDPEGPMGHQTRLRIAEDKVAEHQSDLDNWKPPTHNYVVFAPEHLKILERLRRGGLVR